MINPFRDQAQSETADTVAAQSEGIQGLPKMLLKGGMVVGGLSLLMVTFTFGGSLLSSAPTIGQPSVIALPEAQQSPTATAEPSTQTRDMSPGGG